MAVRAHSVTRILSKSPLTHQVGAKEITKGLSKGGCEGMYAYVYVWVVKHAVIRFPLLAWVC